MLHIKMQTETVLKLKQKWHGRRGIQMLHDLANDDVLKRAAEDREGWRHRERMSKTCSIAGDY